MDAQQTINMTYKDIALNVFIALSTIMTWSLAYFFVGTPNIASIDEVWVFPLLWSYAIIYLNYHRYMYIAVNSYLLFLLMLIADKLTFTAISIKTQLTYLLFAFSAAYIFIGVNQLSHLLKKPSIRIVNQILSCLFLLLPTLYIIYSLNFDSPVSKESIYAVMQTNLSESIDFIIDYISPIWVLFLGIIGSTTAALLMKQEEFQHYKLEKSVIIFMLSIFLVLSYIDRKNNHLYVFTIDAVTEYWQEMAIFKQTQAQLANQDIPFSASKNDVGETYIVIIGESLNKQHMSLYGYMRETTPILDTIAKQHQLLIFDNAFSAHTHTMPVLSQALTEATQANKKDYYHSLSILNILNKANVETYWITNQLLYGAWDNLVSIIAHQSAHLLPFNRSMGKNTNTQSYDGVILEKLNLILKQESKRNRVLFIHLMGNHGNYCSRYPAQYQVFNGDLPLAEFGHIATKSTSLTNTINCYDNSVRYNDFVVGSIIDELKQKKGVNGLIYFSDHSEDVINQLSHNKDNFTYNMTQIPLLIWLSPKYKDKYAKKYRMLQQHRHQLFGNDDMYDTLIGLIDITTDKYDAKNDLTSPQYQLSNENAYTLNGKKWYASPENTLYQQKQNGLFIKKQHLMSRILPHRVNTIGKLSNIWSDGFRAFEVDVLFDENVNQFLVGHDLNVMSGLSLEHLISSVPTTEIKKVWLDIKNLNDTNNVNALTRLNALAAQFDLKNNIIIESNTTKAFFEQFSTAGWHTSYYLPTKQIVDDLNGNKTAQMTTLAKQIAQQSTMQQISAISFENRLYPFVKHYLEPLLTKEIVYHIWDLSIPLYNANLQAELNQQSYYNDNRVKTILLPYQSSFDL